MRNLSKSLTGHWHKLCRRLSRFSTAQDSVLKTSGSGLSTLLSGSADAAAVVTKGLKVLTSRRALDPFISMLY